MLKFNIEAKAKGCRARAGKIETPHGAIETPAFIPVATKATIKSLTPEQVRDQVGAQVILANTYHLYLQPGIDVLAKAGGVGKFMNWPGPTFTDSGGFQAFSLGSAKGRASKIAFAPARQSSFPDLHERSVSATKGKSAEPEGRAETYGEGGDLEPGEITMAKIDDDGVTFKSVIDGSSHRFTPERSIEIQHAIGADIIFAFDECILPQESYERQKQAVERTREWAVRCLDFHASAYADAGGKGATKGNEQALFGIVQGGRYEDLRKLSAKQIGAMDFDGFGIGGSFDKEDIGAAVGLVCDELPENKPRHLLGIGSEPNDLILGIENGIDTFDCVAPARIARNGSAYVSKPNLKSKISNLGSQTSSKCTINLLNARFIDDFSPIDSTCGCYSCENYSRAYIAHLFRAKEMLAATLTTIHNLYYMVNLVAEARKAIIEGKWDEFKNSRLI